MSVLLKQNVWIISLLMLILNIICIISSNAVAFRRDKSIVYFTSVLATLIVCIIITYYAFDTKFLDKGVGFFHDLFHVTSSHNRLGNIIFQFFCTILAVVLFNCLLLLIVIIFVLENSANLICLVFYIIYTISVLFYFYLLITILLNIFNTLWIKDNIVIMFLNILPASMFLSMRFLLRGLFFDFRSHDSGASKIIKINLSGRRFNNIIPLFIIIITFYISRYKGLNEILFSIGEVHITNGCLFLTACLFIVIYNCGQQFFKLRSHFIRFCNAPFFSIIFSDKTKQTFNYKNLLFDIPSVISNEISEKKEKYLNLELNKVLNEIGKEERKKFIEHLDYYKYYNQKFSYFIDRFGYDINKGVKKEINDYKMTKLTIYEKVSSELGLNKNKFKYIKNKYIKFDKLNFWFSFGHTIKLTIFIVLEIIMLFFSLLTIFIYGSILVSLVHDIQYGDSTVSLLNIISNRLGVEIDQSVTILPFVRMLFSGIRNIFDIKVNKKPNSELIGFYEEFKGYLDQNFYFRNLLGILDVIKDVNSYLKSLNLGYFILICIYLYIFGSK